MVAFLLLSMLVAQQAQQADPAAEGDVIVVTGKKGKCRASIADRIVSDAEFHRRAEEWKAGKPVRVVVPSSSDYQCMAKIMFRLNDHGVTNATFVNPGE